jgi:hypothetical protein
LDDVSEKTVESTDSYKRKIEEAKRMLEQDAKRKAKKVTVEK